MIGNTQVRSKTIELYVIEQMPGSSRICSFL